MNRASPIQLNTSLSGIVLENVTESYATATVVFNCAIKTQSHVYTIHGPGSEHEKKGTFPHIRNIDQIQQQDLYCNPGEVLHINPPVDNLISIIFSGLRKNTIIIHGKINHVLIRRSDDVKLFIKQGTVSGLDILYCRRLNVQMPCHN